MAVKETYPDNNPKTAIGILKPSLSKAPSAAMLFMALAFMDGAEKYGPYNWRSNKVTASIYIDACKRHLDAWFDGEENADDSGFPHLGHALACIGILVDAQVNGCLHDDRPPAGSYSKLLKQWTAFLKQRRQDRQAAATPVARSRSTHRDSKLYRTREGKPIQSYKVSAKPDIKRKKKGQMK